MGSMRKLYPYEKAALAFTNKVRKQLGLKPVKRLKRGDRIESLSCPIARTIGHGAEVTESWTEVGAERIKNPASVRRFIERFDKKQYPDLIAK